MAFVSHHRPNTIMYCHRLHTHHRMCPVPLRPLISSHNVHLLLWSAGFYLMMTPPNPGAAPSACEVGAAMIVSVRLGVLGYASNQEHTLAGPPVLLPKLCRSKLSNGLGPFSMSWLVTLDSAKAVALRCSGADAAPVLLHVLARVGGTRSLSQLHDSPFLSGTTQPADPPLSFVKIQKRFCCCHLQAMHVTFTWP